MYKYDQPSDVCMNTKQTERRTDNIESEEKVYNTVGWTLSTFISEYDIPWYCFVIDPSNAELIPHVNITGQFVHSTWGKKNLFSKGVFIKW